MKVVHNKRQKEELKMKRRYAAVNHLNKRIDQLERLCRDAKTREEYNIYYQSGVFLTQVRDKTVFNIKRQQANNLPVDPQTIPISQAA